MKDSAGVTIRIAESPDDIVLARELFKKYGASLGFPLCFQNFEEELATLPGKYALPRGRLLLAFIEGTPVGRGALRFDQHACKMKRLHRPKTRGAPHRRGQTDWLRTNVSGHDSGGDDGGQPIVPVARVSRDSGVLP